MTRKKRRSAASGALQFWRNLAAGEHGPLDRTRRIAGNLVRRIWGGRVVCCGNYGEPGC